MGPHKHVALGNSLSLMPIKLALVFRFTTAYMLHSRCPIIFVYLEVDKVQKFSDILFFLGPSISHPCKSRNTIPATVTSLQPALHNFL